MRTHDYAPTRAGLLAAGLLISALTCQAQTPTELDEIRFTGDIHHRLPATGGGNLISADHTIAAFDLNTGTTDGVNDLGTLDGVGIDGYHNAGDGCGPALYSLDATYEIAATVMHPADIFQSNGTKVLDAAAEGIPDGVNVDAVSRVPGTCDLALSIDVHAEIDNTTFDPFDLIAWNPASGFSYLLNATNDANVDALHLLDLADRILVSTDTDLELDGSVFRDEDVVELALSGGGPFQLAFSPSLFDLNWEPADIDALWVQRTPLFGVFQWETNSVEVFETDPDVSIMVTRTGGDEGSVDVNWTTVADSATAGMDFTADSDVLTLGDGVASGTITVNLLDDAATEGTESFLIQITSVSDGGIGTPQQVRVIIRDDEDFVFADGFEE